MHLMPIVPVFAIAIFLLTYPTPFSYRGRFRFVSMAYLTVALVLLIMGKL